MLVNGVAYVSLITSTSDSMCGVPGLPLDTPYLFIGTFCLVHQFLLKYK